MVPKVSVLPWTGGSEGGPSDNGSRGKRKAKLLSQAMAGSHSATKSRIGRWPVEGPGPDLDRPMNPQLRDDSALPVHTHDRAARALTYT